MIRYFFPALMAVTLMGPAATALRAADSLDGTTWVAPPLDKDAKPDTLRFDKGQFNSSECVQYGYTGGAYETKKKTGALTWTSVQKNAEGDTMDWKGTWDGKSDEMKGRFVYTDKDGKKNPEQEWTAKKKS